VNIDGTFFKALNIPSKVPLTRVDWGALGRKGIDMTDTKKPLKLRA
jgi:hypothetical protein